MQIHEFYFVIDCHLKSKKMNVLLVYPKCPDTVPGFNPLKLISKKAPAPPAGLHTVTAMVPPTWEKKLVDMNVSALNTSDILWANFVFISTLYNQKESVKKVIAECNKNAIIIFMDETSISFSN